MQKRRANVVLDTNVLVSAIVFGGSPRQIIKLQAQKKITIFISPFIMEEVSRILSKKFRFSKKRLQQVQERLERSTKSVIPLRRVAIIKIDEVDNRILEAAVEAKADYIISGDKKHLLVLGTFENIPIISPAEFLKSFKL